MSYIILLYFSSFQSILPHVQMLWELVLAGEVSAFFLSGASLSLFCSQIGLAVVAGCEGA